MLKLPAHAEGNMPSNRETSKPFEKIQWNSFPNDIHKFLVATNAALWKDACILHYHDIIYLTRGFFSLKLFNPIRRGAKPQEE